MFLSLAAVTTLPWAAPVTRVFLPAFAGSLAASSAAALTLSIVWLRLLFPANSSNPPSLSLFPTRSYFFVTVMITSALGLTLFSLPVASLGSTRDRRR